MNFKTNCFINVDIVCFNIARFRTLSNSPKRLALFNIKDNMLFTYEKQFEGLEISRRLNAVHVFI